jgi:hypothetical protein
VANELPFLDRQGATFAASCAQLRGVQGFGLQMDCGQKTWARTGAKSDKNQDAGCDGPQPNNPPYPGTRCKKISCISGRDPRWAAPAIPAPHRPFCTKQIVLTPAFKVVRANRGPAGQMKGIRICRPPTNINPECTTLRRFASLYKQQVLWRCSLPLSLTGLNTSSALATSRSEPSEPANTTLLLRFAAFKTAPPLPPTIAVV